MMINCLQMLHFIDHVISLTLVKRSWHIDAEKNDALEVNISEINVDTSMKTRSSTTNITIDKGIICSCAKKNGDKILYQVRISIVHTNIREGAILINDSDFT